MINYDHHSPSSLNLFAACPSMWVVEKILGQKQVVGVPAHRGVAVEAGVAHGLIKPRAPLLDCVKVANTKYDTLTAMNGDLRREQYRNNMPEMIQMALEELRPYGEPTDVQGFVEWQPRQLKFPIIGYFDFRWANDGLVVDLKTTERMPSEIKISHARQVALYASDNWSGRLTYCTPKKCVTYNLENIRQHRTALLNIAMIVEKLLSLSNEPEYFLSLFAPDLESFYWNGPAMRQLAFKLWGI